MRLTRTNPIPEADIDEVFFPFYEKDNLMKVLENDHTFISEDVRKTIKESVFDDYGYDIYSIFADDDPENFVTLNEIYNQRIKDFSSFMINSFVGTINDDLERQRSLDNFRESELYKEICEKEPDVLQRCKMLMEIIGNNKDSQNSNPPLNFGHQSMASQLPQNQQAPGRGKPGSNSPQPGDMNSRLDALSEFSNTVKSKKKAKDLKDAIAGSRTLTESEKGKLQKVIEAMEKDFIDHGGKGHGEIYQTMAQVLRGIDWSHFYSVNIGNHNSMVNAFNSTKEIESSPLPVDGFRMTKIKRSEQVTRSAIADIAIDDDLFYGKFLNNDLMVKDYIRQRKVSQAFYVLVDVSGSMDGARAVFARSTVKELLRRVVNSGAKYFIRAFDDEVFDLHSATNKQEAEKVDKYLSGIDFGGGGTNIQLAVETALRDIHKDKTKFEDIDILLITDGEDQFHLKKEEMKGITLHTFLLNEGYDKQFGPKEVEKIRKMTNSQFSAYGSNMKYLIQNSETFEIVNPLNQIKENNALLGDAISVGLTSRELRAY